MMIPSEKNFEIVPLESIVNVEIGNLLSPLYFANAEEIREETVTVTLKKDKKIIATSSWQVTTLPFDFWQGIDGDVQTLAAFVRPRLGECAKIREDVVAQLKKWNVDCQLGEYTGGFVHAKQMVCDDNSAVVGTINLDYRSLYLHFENAVYFMNAKAVMDVKEDMEQSFALSKEITTPPKRYLVGRIFDSFLRVFETLV
jgi:phosphatidylserine/phosphatidylglycerophosphate/cardiolipin synthase-like enzyme